MKIVVDDKIPFLKGALEPYADIAYIPGELISNDHLHTADALIIRTRTRCDKKLLKNTRIKFIGTATIGFDHIDTDYCEKNDIVWKNAPGCNASSVSQYIGSTLAHLAGKFGFSLCNKALGVVGVGNTGTKVVQLAELIGMHVYLCDPPRVRNEGICGFLSLEGIVRECDIITFHVPLSYEGQDKTYHMINHELLTAINKGTCIINTSRGEIADSNAMKEALICGHVAGMVLDVWENEPDIDRGLLDMVSLGTPHIAGYSADGKARGTSMIIRELSRYFNLGIDDWEPLDIPEPEIQEIRIDCRGLSNEEVICRAFLSAYNIVDDDKQLRNAPEEFEKQRGEYPPRREFKAYTLILEHAEPELKRTCRKIGFRVLQ